MGNQKSSPAVKQSGDGEVTIINNQDIHTEFHIGHETKLLIIIAIVSLQLVITIYKFVAKRERRQAAQRMAKSVANLAEVTVQRD